MNMEEEIICGYTVTAEQKKANAVLLDLMTRFDAFCAEHGLTWWLHFGGLIGAVRHKGFIPWDDDIDVALPREDFDRLSELAKQPGILEAPYFLQTYESDPGYSQTVTRFRRSDTCFLTKGERHFLEERGVPLNYNMGFGLCVFPLDNLPASKAARKLQFYASYFLRGLVGRSISDKKGSGAIRFVTRILGEKNVARWANDVYRRKPNKAGIVHINDGLYNGYHLAWPAADYAETLRVPFEDITVPIPAGYDDILRTSYGDYMQFPPPEKRGSDKHSEWVFPDTPYTVVRDRLLENHRKTHGA